MRFIKRAAVLSAMCASLAASAEAQQGFEGMPPDMRDLFPTEQFATAVWLDCSTGSMRMALAMRLLAEPDTDYGAVNHVLAPFAADGSSFGLIQALSDWLDSGVAPEDIAARFRMQCVELAAQNLT